MFKKVLERVKIINPIVDYPIIGLAIINCLLLVFIYVVEFYLLKLGIESPNRFGFENSIFGYIIGLIVLSAIIFSTIFLLLIRDIISFVTMQPDGGDPVTSLMIITLCIVFQCGILREHALYLLGLLKLL